MTAAMMVLLLATKNNRFPPSSIHSPSIMLKHKFHTDKASEILTAVREKFSRDSLNQVDGIRIDRKDAWALIRPSGTEPLVRLYVESTDESIAKGFEKEILSCISNFI